MFIEFCSFLSLFSLLLLSAREGSSVDCQPRLHPRGHPETTDSRERCSHASRRVEEAEIQCSYSGQPEFKRNARGSRNLLQSSSQSVCVLSQCVYCIQVTLHTYIHTYFVYNTMNSHTWAIRPSHRSSSQT